MSLQIGITSGISGHFAVLYEAQSGEPVQTGIGRYSTAIEAAKEAKDWAGSDEFMVDDEVKKLLDTYAAEHHR